MSTKEVKRFIVDEKDECPNGDLMYFDDHLAAMAERDELWKRATRFVIPGDRDTGESVEHYIKKLETAMAEKDGEISRLAALSHNTTQELRDLSFLKIEELNETITSQAAEIAEAREMVEKLRKCVEFYSPEEFPWSSDSEFDNGLMAEETLTEIAAIEKAGAKDEL